jgi:hypothetical protein
MRASQKLISVCVLAGTVFAGLFYFNDSSSEKSLPVEKESVRLSIEAEGGSSQITNKVEEKSPLQKVISYIDAKELISWMDQSGMFGLDELKDYAHYDEKTLTAFAENGDLKAAKLLGEKYLSVGNYEKATYYYKLGAVYGSIASISSLATITSSITSLTPEAEARIMAVETLAYRTVMGVRGDKWNSKQRIESFYRDYEHFIGTPLVLTSDEQNVLNARATEIYEDLLQRRRDRGLNAFDNEPPTGVHNIYGLIQ